MREFREVRKRYGGNKEEAQKLTSLARLVLGELKNDLSFNNLSQGQRQRALPDGSIITVESYFDLDVVDIFVPFRERELLEIRDYLQFWRVLEFDSGNNASTKGRFFKLRSSDLTLVSHEVDGELYDFGDDSRIPDSNFTESAANWWGEYYNGNWRKILYNTYNIGKRHLYDPALKTQLQFVLFDGVPSGDQENVMQHFYPEFSFPGGTKELYDSIVLSDFSASTKDFYLRTFEDQDKISINSVRGHDTFLIEVDGIEYIMIPDSYKGEITIYNKNDVTTFYTFSLTLPSWVTVDVNSEFFKPAVYSLDSTGTKLLGLLFNCETYTHPTYGLLTVSGLSRTEVVSNDRSGLVEWLLEFSHDINGDLVLSQTVEQEVYSPDYQRLILDADYSLEQNSLDTINILYFDTYYNDDNGDPNYSNTDFIRHYFRMSTLEQYKSGNYFWSVTGYAGNMYTSQRHNYISYIQDIDLRFRAISYRWLDKDKWLNSIDPYTGIYATAFGTEVVTSSVDGPTSDSVQTRTSGASLIDSTTFYGQFNLRDCFRQYGRFNLGLHPNGSWSTYSEEYTVNDFSGMGDVVFPELDFVRLRFQGENVDTTFQQLLNRSSLDNTDYESFVAQIWLQTRPLE